MQQTSGTYAVITITLNRKHSRADNMLTKKGGQSWEQAAVDPAMSPQELAASFAAVLPAATQAS